MTARREFRFAKWYLDLVSDDGTAFVGYWAELRWRGLAVRYASTFLSPGTGKSCEQSTLRPGTAPTIRDDELTWHCPALGTSGTWRANLGPVRRRLFDSPDGVIDWACVMPRADARVQVGAQVLSGLGYAERLDLTLPPWRLPLDELRWGRFLSAHETLVWIDWRGPHPLTLVLHNGREIPGALITDDAVTAVPARLSIARERILRDDRPLSAVLAAVPMLSPLLPGWFAGLHQQKWLGQGTFCGDGGAPPAAGWVVHELVHWAVPPTPRRPRVGVRNEVSP